MGELADIVHLCVAGTGNRLHADETGLGEPTHSSFEQNESGGAILRQTRHALNCPAVIIVLCSGLTVFLQGPRPIELPMRS